jgi:long-chain acyl-CoA synthetase
MNFDILIERFKTFGDREAIIFNDNTFNYHDILGLINGWKQILKDNNIAPGMTVALTGDYSPESIALVIALIGNRNIVAPLSPYAKPHFEEYYDIASIQKIIDITGNEHTIIDRNAAPGQHELLRSLIDKQHPGLILFTSGSTGQPKAVLHDFESLLSKFVNADKPYRTLCFLLFDHIAGIDTYFYCLFSGGAAIFPRARDVNHICTLIERHGVEVLPTSPSFLNLLMLSGEHKQYNLQSLKVITFGSEKMSEHLLKIISRTFPDTKMVQKYGLTELGSPQSKSKKGDASWIKVDSDSFKTKIIDNVLYVKAQTAMLGYLNSPSPFTEDGWFNTGDLVVIDGEYVKILGRKSDIINVGGEKVYPTEVEAIIQQLDNVADVVVFGETKGIMGQIVCATVQLNKEEDRKQFTFRLKKHCQQHMEKYKIPVKVDFKDDDLHTDRFKKIRRV